MYKLVDNRRYLVCSTWVKNVYRQPYNWFKQCVVSSPVYVLVNNNTRQNNVKVPVVQLFIQPLRKLISTAKKSDYNLLISVYTHNPQSLLLEPIRIN